MKALFWLIALLSTCLTYATTYTVNSAASLSIGTGTTGTLRYCIEQANATSAAGPHVINFSIGTGLQTITLENSLPDINNIVGGVTINGFTQPGWTLNPIIQIIGPGYGIGFNLFNSPNSLVQGIILRGGFGDPYIQFNTCAGSSVRGCWLGVDQTGNTGFGVDYAWGIKVINSSNCNFGGNLTTNPSYKLVIASIGGGIQLNTNSLNATIRGLFSGMNVAGNAMISNVNFYHVEIGTGCHNANVGGAAAGEANFLGGISSGTAIYIQSNGNTIRRNTIGLGSNGTTNMLVGDNGIHILNGINNNIDNNIICNAGLFGVFVENGTGTNPCRNTRIQNNWIGVKSTGNIAAGNQNSGIRLKRINQARILTNVIAGNQENGIYFDEACDSNLVRENRIGLGANGTTVLVNGTTNNHHGIYVASNGSERNSFKNNTVVTPGRGSGLKLDYGSYDTIAYNYFGLTTSGLVLVGIGSDANTHGIAIQNDVSNIEITGNVIAGSKGDGIRAAGTCSNYIIRGNIVGMNKDGLGTTFGNDGTGIYFSGGTNKQNITIGGSTAADRNIVSKNGINVLHPCNDTKGYGIILEYVNGATIRGNYIGVDATGLAPAGNGGSGIMINGGSNNVIVGGINPGEGNIVCDNGRNCSGIPANVRHGVQFVSNNAATNMQVQGNYIGLGIDGTTLMGNAEEGVSSWQTPNLIIGGTTAAHRNYIAGNNKGVFLQPASATNCRIIGNFIGTDITGTIAKPNYIGVHIGNGATGNFVGGPNAGDRNIISGNTFSGILFENGDNNTVQQNLIGLTNSLSPLPNGTNGITIRQDGAGGSTGNLIGHPSNTSLGNVIAYNVSNGISIADASSNRNQIRRNSIYCNGSSRVNGINLNGLGNNNLSNPGPLVVPTYITAPNPGIQTANTPVNDVASSDVVEVFYDDACGTCQGRTFLGNATISGTQWSFGPLPAAANCTPKGAPGCLSGVKNISATRTDNTGNTSEFMDCDPVALPVEMVQFEIQKSGSKAVLLWSTISEKDNDYFEVLRSIDGFSFESIYKIKGKGNSQSISLYQYENEITSGITYFMLMQYDLDGTAHMVGIRSIESSSSISVFPTLVQPGGSILVESEGKSYLSLWSLQGQILLKKEFSESIEIEVPISNGIYFLSIQNGSEEKIEKLVIK
ncbi:MAG: T9SS type A sorting domain-containing protein [Cytophagaceae bacterium]|jgi:hypothetical protein|nr:T9SS type A sorting domain-containing protein [Cytophagaceae bacterium]